MTGWRGSRAFNSSRLTSGDSGSRSSGRAGRRPFGTSSGSETVTARPACAAAYQQREVGGGRYNLISTPGPIQGADRRGSPQALGHPCRTEGAVVRRNRQRQTVIELSGMSVRDDRGERPAPYFDCQPLTRLQSPFAEEEDETVGFQHRPKFTARGMRHFDLHMWMRRRRRATMSGK